MITYTFFERFFYKRNFFLLRQFLFTFFFLSGSICFAHAASVAESASPVSFSSFGGSKILAAAPGTWQQSPADTEKWMLSGMVKDDYDIPLGGVSVLLKGAEKGTTTNIDGEYQIMVKKGDVLVFSYVGFTTRTFEITDQKKLDVMMKIMVTVLDEIVLTGYATERKEKISTATVKLKEEDLKVNLQSGASFEKSLSGMLSGVLISQGSGRPGSGVDINIRGVTSPFSNANNNPLFVIDGVPFFSNFSTFSSATNPLLSLNPEDIESIDVLKDAAATAIYGSRGANGVVMVKTKQGKRSNPISVNVSLSTTAGRPIKTLDVLNAQEYKRYAEQLIKNSIEFAQKNPQLGLGATLSRYADFGVVSNPFTGELRYDASKAKFGNADINWADEVYRKPALTTEYAASVSAGTEKSSYFLSLRHVNQEGLLLEDRFKQYNLRLSLDTDLGKKVTAGVSANLGLSRNASGYVNVNQNLGNKLLARPDLPIRNEKGDFSLLPQGPQSKEVNPLALTTQNNHAKKGLTATANTYLKVEPIENLTFKVALNTSVFHSDADKFTVPNRTIAHMSPISLLQISRHRTNNLVLDFTANYRLMLNAHSLSALLGASRNREYTSYVSMGLAGFPDNKVLITAPFAQRVDEKNGNNSQSGINSGFGRLTYSYNDRFTLTTTLRFDRSSKFAPAKQTAWFPSIAANWNLHREEFLKNSPIDELKLRLSYGVSGSTNVDDFAFRTFFEPGTGSSGRALYNGQQTIGPRVTLANTDIGWEKTTEINAGLDLSILSEMISGSIDVYNRRTVDALMQIPVPNESGVFSYTRNFATIDNKGIELRLNTILINKEKLTWSTGLNIAKNINTLVEFDQTINAGEDVLRHYIKGESINIIRGYVVEGIIKTKKELDELNSGSKSRFYHRPTTGVGDYKYKDLNGDGQIDRKDMQIIGSSDPKWFGGFNTRVGFLQHFEFSAYFNFSVGQKTEEYHNNIQEPFSSVEKRFDVQHRWSENNPDATLPRLLIGFASMQNNVTSTARLHDASFLRLKALQFSYTLPRPVVEKVAINNAQIYLAANNLLTWTKFPGIDPESTNGAASMRSSQNTNPYPAAKSWTIGLKLNF